MNKQHLKSALLIILIMFLITSCFPGGGGNTPIEPAGFFKGIWHGWIAPLSLIFSIFNDNIRIYEVFNTGWTYDLGFYIAIIGGFGSFSLFRKKKKDD